MLIKRLAFTLKHFVQTHGVEDNIWRVVSGISDTSLYPVQAVQDTVTIFDELFPKLSSPVI